MTYDLDVKTLIDVVSMGAHPRQGVWKRGAAAAHGRSTCAVPEYDFVIATQ